MKLAALAFRNIRRNRRRSLLSGSAIALATLAISFMFSWLAGLLGDYRSNVVHYVTGHVRLRNPQYEANERLNPLHLSVPGYRELLPLLEAEPGVAAVAPRVQFATAIYREEQTYGALGLGLDFPRERQVMRVGDSLTAGRLPDMGQREMLLGAGLAEEVGAAVGDRITLLGKNKYQGLAGMTFTVTGIARFPVAGFNRTFLLVPIDTAELMLKMQGEATEVLILARDERRETELSARVNRTLAEAGVTGVVARPWERIGMWSSMIRIIDSMYNFIALFFFILGTTVIINTTMMVIFERMREIGTVAALGMKPGEIVRLFFLEAFFISVIAALVGVLAGTGVTLALSRHGLDLSQMLQGVDIEVSPVIRPELNLRSTVFVFFYSVAVASLASFLPSRRAARIRPVEALRSI
jgi:putative ABC transport system permease protein